MATGDYCTLDELKAELSPELEIPDSANDTPLESVITAVSRLFDTYTGTRFYTTSSDETRYYDAWDSGMCWIDPAQSITSVATDDSADRSWGYTWTEGTHFETWPYNTSAHRTMPIMRIDRMPLGDYSFPSLPKAVKVVGKFGWDSSVTASTTLDDVKRACLLQCTRLFKRKDSPFGVMSISDFGQVTVIPRLDPDVKLILDQYRVNYT